jgi:hypothetical protein
VRRDKARDDDLAGRIERGPCLGAGGRRADGNACDPAGCVDQYMADERGIFTRPHRQQGGIAHQEIGVRGRRCTDHLTSMVGA